VTCQEVLESITAAVDGALSHELVPRFQDHITRCDHCRAEFELEQATKTLVRSRLRPRTAPDVLRERISAALAEEGAPVLAEPVRPRRRAGLFGRPLWQFALGVGATAVAALVITVVIPSRTHHAHTSPVDGNIIHQTYNNYDGFLDGKLVPQIASSDPSVVQAYIQPAVDFHFNVPKMKRYTLVGGNSTMYGKHHLAHLVYRHDKDVVYLYQARYSDVLDGTSLSLPADALDELKRTGWYFENHVPDCSLIVWVTDSIVCCVIADVSKDQLLASLQESE
jgi:mycothiol system anti-sigma-R factor